MLAHDSKPSMLLQQPGQMGPLRLKNRVVIGPMGTNFGTTDGLVAPCRADYSFHH
jgi:2,4-dienoyl-CoA reductase-like NADH-dependent reductase (Old Yellow Enzyme family)